MAGFASQILKDINPMLLGQGFNNIQTFKKIIRERREELCTRHGFPIDKHKTSDAFLGCVIIQNNIQ